MTEYEYHWRRIMLLVIFIGIIAMIGYFTLTGYLSNIIPPYKNMTYKITTQNGLPATVMT